MVPSTEPMLFNKHVYLPTDGATLIEGLSDHGMVGSIALDKMVELFASSDTRGSGTLFSFTVGSSDYESRATM